MKGLLLKDFYSVCKYCRFFAIVVGVFLIVSYFGDGNLFFTIYPCLIAGMVPITLISYEDRDKWHIFAQTLPFTRAQIVSAKYITGLCSVGIMLLLTAIAQTIQMVNAQSFLWADLGQLLLLILSIGLIFPAIALPIVFQFGVEKGRILFIVMIAMAGGGTAALINVELADTFLAGKTALVIVLVCAGAAVLYALSWLLSIQLYKRRQLR